MKRVFFICLLLVGCQPPPEIVVSNHVSVDSALVRQYAPLPPLPSDPTNPVADSEVAAQLGQAIFYDPGYSKNQAVSCATCHRPELAFTDGLPTARAIGLGRRNTPAIGLAAYQRWQGWGGRADSLGGQSLAALQHPLEMGMDVVSAARRVLTTQGGFYRDVFKTLPDTSHWPPDGGLDDGRLSVDDRAVVKTVAMNIGNALGAYMRKLVPGPSAFDRYAMGDAKATSSGALEGFMLFNGKARCAICHKGPLFSDGVFHNIGVPQALVERDRGRKDDLPLLLADAFRVSTDLPSPAPDDDGRFRTPSLRDVSRTAPYWHAGTFATLEQALDFDLAGGLNKPGNHFPGIKDPEFQPVSLTQAERAALLEFLRSLEMTPVPLPWGGPPTPPTSVQP